MSWLKWVVALPASLVILSSDFVAGSIWGPHAVRSAYYFLRPNQKPGAEPSKFWKKTSTNHKIMVFVHGVTGTANETWLYTGPEGKIYWPDIVKDDEQLKDYDIFVASYYTPQADIGPTINDIAQALHNDLEEKKILPDSNNPGAHPNYDEVIFVAHSMGNLVVRNMLILYPPPRDASFRVPLILSLASPSAGSALSELGERFSLNPTFREMAKFETNSFLQLLNQVFKRSGVDTEIACAYETKIDGRIGRRVVEQDSATAVCTRKDVTGFAADHVGIVKPSGPKHPLHVWLVDQITRAGARPGWVLDRWADNEIVIGGKDYAESNLQAAMFALMLRANPQLKAKGVKIKVQYDYGHASRIYTALVNRAIDIYPEYDGSLLYEYLRKPMPSDPSTPEPSLPMKPDDVEGVNLELQKGLQTINMQYFPHLGFNNPYVLVMKREKAQELGFLDDGKVTMSELVGNASRDLILVADQEFLFRNEWSVLKERYNLTEMKTELAKHDQLYVKLNSGRADRAGYVAVGFATDTQLDDRDYVIIEDDRRVLPDYYVAPLVDKLVLRYFPPIEESLRRLSGVLSLKEMSSLIKEYESLQSVKGGTAGPDLYEGVARVFLQKRGLLPN
jgi:glycine betaine/choline ABC-type transport system substrate-binding protein